MGHRQDPHDLIPAPASPSMQRPEPPDMVRRLADARQDARDARNFAEADRLRDEIEAAGWSVVDQAHSYRLHRAHPADVTEPDGRTRYGWSGAVPSRLADAPGGMASIVVIAPDDPDLLEGALAALAGAVADDVQRVVVGNAPGPETEMLLMRLGPQWAAEAAARGETAAGVSAAEVVWLVDHVGAAAALNAGIRRAAGPVVILLDAQANAVGDFVSPLAGALDDPTVAVAGPWGYRSNDLRRFEPVAAAAVGDGEAVAVAIAAMAFRRADYVARGPLDERFVDAPLLDAWWSLVLRDPDENEMTPRRAMLVDVPLVRGDTGRRTHDEEAAAERIVRRNRYRIIDTFGGRRDLAAPGWEP